ncbi:MAG: 23S rRNA (uracil(1939)-C(5))-methyltransferase RlmD [Eubacterium sp.]
MEINDKIEMNLVDITHSGEGVGREENMIVFVDGGVPGDKAEVEITTLKKTYALGKILNIIEPSPERVEPACPYFGKCGGCQLLHVNYAEQLRIKGKMVKDAIERIGDLKTVEVEPVIGMENPTRYRNKAQYKIDKKGMGFYEKKSHHIIPITDCLTQPKSCSDVIKTFNELVKTAELSIYNEHVRKGYLRGILQRTNLAGENMIIIIVNGKSLSKKEIMIDAILKGIPNVKSIFVNVNTSKGNAILGKKSTHIYGQMRLDEVIGELHYSISPNSFFQVNSIQTKVLYDLVKKMADLKGSETLFDLYCGTGTIGLYLAKGAKEIYGIEIVGDAVRDARENAELNKIENATFIEGKAEIETGKLVEKGIKPDIIVLDPPRKGCEPEILEMIHTLKTKKVIYVSCNPSTLARDLKIMAENGYNVDTIQPIDLFPGTGHVETVVKLTR